MAKVYLLFAVTEYCLIFLSRITICYLCLVSDGLVLCGNISACGIAKLEEEVRSLIQSIYWVVESKRVDRSYEKMASESLVCPCAPGEEKYRIGLDSKSSKCVRIL